MWFISYVIVSGSKSFKNAIIKQHPMAWLFDQRALGVDARINFFAKLEKTGLKKAQINDLAQLLA